MERVVNYRMDRYGRVFVRYLCGKERQACHVEARAILTEMPEIALTLSNKG